MPSADRRVRYVRDKRQQLRAQPYYALLDTSAELRLTMRQRQIARLAVRGCTDKEIAARLGISQATVRTHLRRMYRENRLRSRSDLIRVWTRTPGAGRSRPNRR